MAVPAMVPFTVFSAHAEVVPPSQVGDHGRIGILRARGGSSVLFVQLRICYMYSPRTRR